jgi:uncharacterized membrane protein YebE (DUF533 family)
MFNAKEILGQLMQGARGMAAPGGGNASSQGSLAGGLGGLLGNPAVTGALSGAGGGLLAGLLLGSKKARNIGGKVALAGGAAALGAIAFKAFSNWKAGQDTVAKPATYSVPQPQQPVLDFNCLPDEQQEDHSRAMLAAIVAAAKADGRFDAKEQQIIREQVAKIGDAETAEWVQQEIRKPVDAGRIAAMAASPEVAAEIYLASLMVIDEQNEHEKRYLNALADKMGMEPRLRQEIEQQWRTEGGTE